jgi:hypothetical protein
MISKHGQLVDLVVAVWEEHKLRRVARDLGLANDLPGQGVAPTWYADELVDRLNRRGLASAAFFERLRADAGPGREAAVVVAAAAWGVSLSPAQAPAVTALPVTASPDPPPPAPASWDFFLAHASPDKPTVRALCAQLKPHGPTFLDEEAISLGDVWDQRIHQALLTTRIVVIFVSKASAKAFWQNGEVKAAIARWRHEPESLRLVPVFIDGWPRHDDPVLLELRQFQGVDLSATSVEALASQLVRLRNRLAGRESLTKEED